MVGSWEVYMEWTDRIKLSFAGEVGLKRSGGAERAPSGKDPRHGSCGCLGRGECSRTRGRHEGCGGRKGAWLENFVKTEKTRKADELGE